MSNKRQPQNVLITGAASGIGREMARVCAANGWNLVCIDLNKDGLETLSLELTATHDIQVLTFPIDLTLRDAPEKCLAFCDDNHVDIDFLINNAGVFFFDPLLDSSPQRVAIMSDLHIYCLTRMCMLFGERMKSRRFGYILNMSSLSAWTAMPGISTYNATKAYVRSLSRSLWFELKPWNVSVTAVCPGGINTQLLPLPDNIRKLAVTLRCLMAPDALAKKAIKAALKRKKEVIPGAINHFFKYMILLLPDFLIAFAVKHIPVYNRFWPQKPELTDKSDNG